MILFAYGILDSLFETIEGLGDEGGEEMIELAFSKNGNDDSFRRTLCFRKPKNIFMILSFIGNFGVYIVHEIHDSKI